LSKPLEPKDEPTGINFLVQGIVAQRNQQPYVQFFRNEGMIAQVTVKEARNIAFDILRSASYAEADAMIVRFFGRLDLSPAALGALMIEFRDFRHELDMEKIETSTVDPDTGEEV